MHAESTGLVRLRAGLDWLLIAIFLLALLGPTIDELWRPAELRGPRSTELREPAPRPSPPTTLEALGRYARAYEEWFQDYFGLRDRLLRWGSWIKLFGFGVSPTPTVEIGRDGWMYYTGNESAPAFRGVLPFSEDELDDWQAMLENHAAVTRELGIASLYVIGPNKETIYPERVPPWWNKVGPSRLDQLHDRLRTRADRDVRLLDLRTPLLAAKTGDVPGDFLYYEYGTHWNGRGTYVAYREVLAALRERVPRLWPLPASFFLVLDGVDHGDTWGRAMYLDDLLPQRNIGFNLFSLPVKTTESTDRGVHVFVIEGPFPDQPRAVMFHDSFGNSIQHMLAPHFSRLVCYATPIIDEAVLAREKPDVLLEIFVERQLVTTDPALRMLGHGELAARCFEKSDQRLFELTRANLGTALVPRGAARVVGLAENGLATVTIGDANAYLRVAPFALPARGDLLVHVDVDSNVDSELLVLPVHGAAAEPRWQRATRLAIHPGSNSVHLLLPRHALLTGIALQPGHDPGDYVLRAFEVRAVPVR